MNDKLQQYELQVLQMKSLPPERTAPWAIEGMRSFPDSIFKAANMKECTVTAKTFQHGLEVSGAEVRYVLTKPGASESQFGTSSLTREIERANYIFKSYRDGKLTGQTAVKNCMRDTEPVEIHESP